MTQRTLDLVHELSGLTCRCGHSKVAKQGFCHGCYVRLPDTLKSQLYRRIGHGYEEAYDRAVEILVGLKRVIA
jgi:CDGSH-type Zn-finger protein